MPTDFDLLRSLEDEPRTPSTVDVRRAIADGRRRRRLRRGIGYTSAAAVTALAVAGTSFAASGLSTKTPKNAAATGGAAASSKPAVTPPTSCTLNRLPVPDNEPMALVTGGDPTGQYLVGRTYPKGGGYQAVIWHDGQVKKVMLPGDLEESLRDVNSSGTAVGWSYLPTAGGSTVENPYVYQDGKVSKLPGMRSGEAVAINDAGEIVGNDDKSGAVVWRSATAKPTRLPLPAGAKAAMASGIDEDGTVVGTVDMSRPYIWLADGTHHELAMPTIDGKTAVGARVSGIRNGWAMGVAYLDDSAAKGPAAGKVSAAKGNAGQFWAVRWNVRTGEVVSVTSGVDVEPGIINAQGWQVGIDKQGQAMLVADGATVVLPDLHTHTPGGLQNIANSLSDDGRTIGGQSDDKADVIQAVVWRCK